MAELQESVFDLCQYVLIKMMGQSENFFGSFFYSIFIIKISEFYNHNPEGKTIREGCKNDYPMDEKRREKITFKLLISPPPYCDKVGITTDEYLKKFAAANCFFP